MCTGTLIPDFMHDLLEGALQHILKHLLHVLICKKRYFTVMELNSKIAGMEFGFMDGNRHSPLTRGELRENCILCTYVTVHAKTYHKSAKNIFAFAYDFALLRPSARPCKI